MSSEPTTAPEENAPASGRRDASSGAALPFSGLNEHWLLSLIHICHAKRYRDVEELLHAGIDVFTTVNVQHLESLNDKVSATTEVVVQERIPDRIFDYASSVELVDLDPDLSLIHI